MCGRYALFSDPEAVAAEFGLGDADFEPTYNAAPSQDLPVILDDAPERLSSARWGLVPEWSDGPRADPDPINARAESLTEKRHFSEAYEQRRCLVPVDGFYEWVADADGKTPYFVSRADDRPFLLAGIWETWTPEQTQTGLGEFGDGGGPTREAETVRSFTIVTTEPNDFLADYHHRMAVPLDREQGEQWLTAEDPGDLLTPREFGFEAWPVSPAVNDPSNDHSGLVEPVP
ncbi:SOS response-associated peptidase [Halobacterium jilantaiense]|uniref:Putative SOS response-associated peptidase YedK n=1 Tax=Halobacterium jilantaiense TaxID=355548 RepID=A0A1I0NEN9_9EURY|nr:SOS response-associated peptidase [Halobacterium jilantaiense]SEV99471.1 Putative SOS response-associated peptidase YedK [Halobacterium jilantaiense]